MTLYVPPSPSGAVVIRTDFSTVEDTWRNILLATSEPIYLDGAEGPCLSRPCSSTALPTRVLRLPTLPTQSPKAYPGWQLSPTPRRFLGANR